MASKALSALQALSSAKRAASNKRFFKTGPGQYGEGDQFMGVTNPDVRKVAAECADLGDADVIELLQSPLHEARLLGIIIWGERVKRAADSEKQDILQKFVQHRKAANNWDLVDTAAPTIVGPALWSVNGTKKQKKAATAPDIALLREWAASASLWDRRLAMVSTLTFIRNGYFEATIELAKILLSDKEDLMHKAVGWMLREIGKRDESVLLSFLDEHSADMPRTALRYSIERLNPKEQKHYMHAKDLTKRRKLES
eukprot:TRINITY_DN9448_c0_g1_i2.p2 TRINITY_DN9448_c0_g1~~TRINITY_DN9448_c0_g1_i2.p2  ORF type:complete len:256 (+),score=42.15 TRINITY_DN9448_c0_g1_i2:34-801(+)